MPHFLSAVQIHKYALQREMSKLGTIPCSIRTPWISLHNSSELWLLAGILSVVRCHRFLYPACSLPYYLSCVDLSNLPSDLLKISMVSRRMTSNVFKTYSPMAQCKMLSKLTRARETKVQLPKIWTAFSIEKVWKHFATVVYERQEILQNVTNVSIMNAAL